MSLSQAELLDIATREYSPNQIKGNKTALWWINKVKKELHFNQAVNFYSLNLNLIKNQPKTTNKMATSTKTKKQTATVKTKKTVKKTQPKADSLSKQQKTIIAQQKKRDAELFKTPLKENEALVSYRMLVFENVNYAVGFFSFITYKNLHTNEYYFVRNTNILGYLFPFLRNHIWQTAYVISEEELLKVIAKQSEERWTIWDRLKRNAKEKDPKGAKSVGNGRSIAKKSLTVKQFLLIGTGIALSFPIRYNISNFFDPLFSLLPAKNDELFVKSIMLLLIITATISSALIAYLIVQSIFKWGSYETKKLEFKSKIKVKGMISRQGRWTYVWLLFSLIFLLLPAKYPLRQDIVDSVTKGGEYAFSFDLPFVLMLLTFVLSNLLMFQVSPNSKHGPLGRYPDKWKWPHALVESLSYMKSTSPANKWRWPHSRLFPSFIIKIKK